MPTVLSPRPPTGLPLGPLDGAAWSWVDEAAVRVAPARPLGPHDLADAVVEAARRTVAAVLGLATSAPDPVGEVTAAAHALEVRVLRATDRLALVLVDLLDGDGRPAGTARIALAVEPRPTP